MDNCIGCPSCGHKRTLVTESRVYETALVKTLRRRRTCPQCKHRYWTMEIPEEIAKDVYTED